MGAKNLEIHLKRLPSVGRILSRDSSVAPDHTHVLDPTHASLCSLSPVLTDALYRKCTSWSFAIFSLAAQMTPRANAPRYNQFLCAPYSRLSALGAHDPLFPAKQGTAIHSRGNFLFWCYFFLTPPLSFFPFTAPRARRLLSRWVERNSRPRASSFWWVSWWHFASRALKFYSHSLPSLVWRFTLHVSTNLPSLPP